MKTLFVIALVALVSSAALSARVDPVEKFLSGQTHCMYPPVVNYASSPKEMARCTADLGYDVVHIGFCGPYNSGNIDTSSVDESLSLLDAKGKKAVLYVNPRFNRDEGICDTLNDGRIITNQWNVGCNAFMVDVFDEAQRGKFADYIARIAQKYGTDDRVAGFVVSWGYMGETGFWIGDFLGDFGLVGTENSGYSKAALVEFNKWRKKHKLAALKSLPLPSPAGQSRDYVLFHRFRAEFVRDVFHRDLIAAAKKHTKKPVGIYNYVSVSTYSGARDWTGSPTADFLRSGGCTASLDMKRTLIETGVGVEDTGLSDGARTANAENLERDMARQIARGNTIMFMYIDSMDSPPWEKGTIDKLSTWVLTEQKKIEAKMKRTKPLVAVYQPTWGTNALPSQDEKHLFLSKLSYEAYFSRMMSLTESCGVNYVPVTEDDLLEPKKLWKSYRKLILPMWGDCLKLVLGPDLYEAYSKDARVARIPLMERAPTRTEFKSYLSAIGIKGRLDYNGEKVVVGMQYNMVYNFDNSPHDVVVDGVLKVHLEPCSWTFVPE